MRVCIVSTCFTSIPPVHGGGIESQVYGLAQALTKYRVEVHVITLSNGCKKSPYKGNNLHFHRVRTPVEDPASSGFINSARCEILYAHKAAEIAKRLNIDLIHYNTTFTCFFGLRILNRVPKIYHVHNWRAIENPILSWNIPTKRLVHEVTICIDKYNAKRVDKIITISNFMKNGILSTAHIDENKVSIVPNSVSLNTFYPDQKNEGRDNSILFVGRLFPEKGLDYLIKAIPLVLHEIPDAKLVVVGPKKFGVETGGFERYIKDLIRSLNLEKHVEFKERIPVNELRCLYSKAGIFVLPAVWNEPFGLVLLEAMACQAPVIGTRVGGIPEIIEGKDAGILVQPKSVKELAEAIISILTDKKLALRMGSNGKKLVEQYYAWDINAKRIYDIYEEVIS